MTTKKSHQIEASYSFYNIPNAVFIPFLTMVDNLKYYDIIKEITS